MKLTHLFTTALLFFTTTGSALTVEEQIGQLLIPYVDGETADDSTYAFLRSYQPGGIILYEFSNGLHSYKQTKDLAIGLQKQAAELNLLPLFIAADQEGGRVARLRHGFTEFPGNAVLGKANSEELAFLSAREMGCQMLEAGVNFTFAPVVDINSNPNNPVIGTRSYGDTSELVTRLGKAASLGFSSAGVMSCLKHFPGHGDVTIDTHDALATVDKSREELEALELIPFREIGNRSPAIMTAHLRIPLLDPNRCATLSKPILTDLLRNEMGYNGLIITDSLTMGAVIEDCGNIGEAAVRAVEAGSDLLIIGGRKLNDPNEPIHHEELLQVKQALLKAVHDGRITTERLQESVDRILKAKEEWHIGKAATTKSDRRFAEQLAHSIKASAEQASDQRAVGARSDCF